MNNYFLVTFAANGDLVVRLSVHGNLKQRMEKNVAVFCHTIWGRFAPRKESLMSHLKLLPRFFGGKTAIHSYKIKQMLVIVTCKSIKPLVVCMSNYWNCNLHAAARDSRWRQERFHENQETNNRYGKETERHERTAGKDGRTFEGSCCRAWSMDVSINYYLIAKFVV